MEGKFLISSKENLQLHFFSLLFIGGPPFKDDHTLMAVSFYNGGMYDFCAIIDDLSVLLVFILIYRRQPMA